MVVVIKFIKKASEKDIIFKGFLKEGFLLVRWWEGDNKNKNW